MPYVITKQQYLMQLLYIAYNQYKKNYQPKEPQFYLLPPPRLTVRERVMNDFLERALAEIGRTRLLDKIGKFRGFVAARDQYNDRVNHTITHRNEKGQASFEHPALTYEMVQSSTIEHPDVGPVSFTRLEQLRDTFIERVTLQGLWPRAGYPTCIAHRTGVIVVDEFARFERMQTENLEVRFGGRFSRIRNIPAEGSLKAIDLSDLASRTDRQG